MRIPRNAPPPSPEQKAALTAVEIASAGLNAYPRDPMKLALLATAQERLRQLMQPRPPFQ
ncbi:MAG: hypothetical protein PHE68_01330 [Candidatus Peribacteraceae bacterium]|nr:hypothetical protein [Candidatus Peribacteraceae bacterium]MDD5074570.1 hypothetical protein [Candidatus Peribacteraceae bacterium]